MIARQVGLLPNCLEFPEQTRAPVFPPWYTSAMTQMDVGYLELKFMSIKLKLVGLMLAPNETYPSGTINLVLSLIGNSETALLHRLSFGF